MFRGVLIILGEGNDLVVLAEDSVECVEAGAVVVDVVVEYSFLCLAIERDSEAASTPAEHLAAGISWTVRLVDDFPLFLDADFLLPPLADFPLPLSDLPVPALSVQTRPFRSLGSESWMECKGCNIDYWMKASFE